MPANKYCDRYKKEFVSQRKKMVAICPRCSKEHMISIYYSQRGKPRIYCAPCKQLLKEEGD